MINELDGREGYPISVKDTLKDNSVKVVADTVLDGKFDYLVWRAPVVTRVEKDIAVRTASVLASIDSSLGKKRFKKEHAAVGGWVCNEEVCSVERDFKGCYGRTD